MFILTTLYQNARRIQFKRKPQKRTPRLRQCPQKRGLVIRPRIVTPRKPNSARRPVAKVRLSNYRNYLWQSQTQKFRKFGSGIDEIY